MGRARLLCALTCVAVTASLLVPAQAAAGGGCHTGFSTDLTEARGAAGEPVAAVIEECAFQPTVLYVEPGAEVTWENKDFFDHTVTGAALSWGSERFLAKGDTITQRFTKEGVFPYFCLLHPSMVGAVVVGDPDPEDVTEKTSTIDSAGVDTGVADDQSGSGGADGARAAADPASDSIPMPALLATIALLGIAAAGVLALLRRRRIEHGV